MMDHRKALTISLTVDKDNSTIGNPLRIPMTCFSSGYGKLERQIHWTKFTGSKARYNDSKHKNGSMQFDHHEAALVRLGMASRKPCLILTDVLKTEPGRAYLDGKRRDQTSGNGRRLSSLRSENSRRREEPLVCGERRSGLREAKHKVLPNTNKSDTPKRNQRTLSLSSERLRLRSRSEDAEQEDVKEEDKEVMEVIIGEDNGENDKNAEVVDCGLSLSWKPTADTGGDELSPASTKNDCPEPESDEQCSVKRKRENAESHCNGTGTPTGHRGSVLRLSGEAGRDRGPAAKRLCPEERGEDSEVDHGILQLTVGGDDRTERGLSPVVSPRSEAPETRGVPRQSLSTSQDNPTQATPSEPIVLSSDDEEGSGIPRPCGPVFHTLVSVGETATQGQPSQEVEAEQQDVSHMQLVHVVVEDFPGTEASSFGPPPVHRADGSSMSMAFSVLHCGGFQAEANGALMITHQRVIIPLKDASGQVEVTLTLEPRELRRYSVWEQQELQALGLGYRGKEQPSPAALLLFYVSDTQAAAIQRDLCKLSLRQLGPTPMGPASPFVLLSLRDALEGVEGAVVYSILDIICLNNLTHQKSSVAPSLDSISMLEDIHSPALSLDQTLELIRITGLDPQLLSLLGVDSTDPESNTDQDGPQSDGENKNEPHSQLEFESQIESVPQLDTEPEQDTEPQLKPEEEKEKEPPAEEKSEEPAPIYTLCHRRTRGSYSVFLAKPDSSWTKYTHQGLARRLIQFPPPPLKGGITVTMEDLQCLDSGQFLNDVIIDFYLKYLLQNASAAVAERSHIFSSFFYKQLTRRDNASESGTSDSCQRQRRHQRVKTWTRHVDIFKKDFLFVPVNQEAHWYLVVICFPGLDEPQFEPWTGPGLQKGNRTGEAQAREEAQRCRSSHVVSEASPASNSSENMDKLTENAQEDSTKESPPGPPNCTEQTCQREVICKRPCILIMDSLKLSLHERVFKLLREYLQSEWEVRRGSVKDFSTEQMKNSHCRVPLQDNSSDCGLYLLQYVESFLKDPVVHFDLPLRLERWFPRQQVRRKRDEIRDLILNLYRYQNQENVVR
ncbi:sentrin-specific protease 7 isoform X2 [Myripristis murdjan]|uniref:sentrin-specific protease 7 isoform X2 n=1 Tax=Myripristis murdjan TaxID=586833 RepID=UPI0011761010|nr:sentrin-specific protease 7-like isoform X2 [Myripristis murdjan]